ncbi:MULTISPECIES: formimidoylglutamate deiminase [unclassified Rhizobium]|uniref:formimidoylglutamate deiminase n=1 Tax=unclassified Rhizobium TaxID=2613769 RepID=UPI000DDF849C|nr:MULTISPECIES: formimidoylglutamate deiminase [unclassified Rhizobium]MBB3286475.1 formiminoglutamate deiminase [Rhizobium sp. BK252]MBB3401331.1 formiminoglutamate deiminase [Rhizobium sp. BK289]MBB3413909.1 formiminoglutamate deiminase [Rhizobium sp. BK284]MBB3481796.1 formiminoglutamate deiminase [Rhizobium sp. BK347]MDK4719611.1 formimidoylglutamate deiminase [Rhizobium sp. CNPSo 3968]
MTRLHARVAMLGDGWHENVRLTLEGGRIAEIVTDVAPEAGDDRQDVLVPAMPNLHSHAFQRAMAGLAEVRGPANDSFWSWRTVMYKFALSMTPDHVEAVAAQLYMEMLEAGFSRVGEFHYLHHDKDGSQYANIAELAERIGAASTETGIALTLLPVFYAHSGFGGAAPIDGQRRFINSIESFEALMAGCRTVTSRLPGAELGIAPHSLRAVTPEELAKLVPIAGEGPIHIHVAEQVKEVEDCIAWSGARPVQWLLDNAPVNERWCLIHATHMTEDETRRMARSGAIAGLCPITEANLGDGVFPAPLFLEAGGHYGVGSDSNILISVPEELRQLEYSQRLALRARNVIATSGGSTARMLFDGALAGGGAALKAAAGLAVGNHADIVSLDVSAAPYLSGDRILDHWTFAGGVKVDGVWALGRKQVEGGHHIKREAISARFRKAMAELIA